MPADEPKENDDEDKDTEGPKYLPDFSNN